MLHSCSTFGPAKGEKTGVARVTPARIYLLMSAGQRPAIEFNDWIYTEGGHDRTGQAGSYHVCVPVSRDSCRKHLRFNKSADIQRTSDRHFRIKGNARPCTREFARLGLPFKRDDRHLT